MSGVATGQVFTEDELELLLDWYDTVSGDRGLGAFPADVALRDKIQSYRDQVACRVPR